MIRNSMNLDKALNRLNKNVSPIPEHIAEKMEGVFKKTLYETSVDEMDDKFKGIK